MTEFGGKLTLTPIPFVPPLKDMATPQLVPMRQETAVTAIVDPQEICAPFDELFPLFTASFTTWS